MKKIVLLISFSLVFVNLFGQQANQNSSKRMTKFIAYNCFGMQALPAEQIMIGGNHIFFKKAGFGISYRFGIKDFMEPVKGLPGDQKALEMIRDSNLFTGDQSISYAYFFVPSISIAITPKIPIYIGVGLTKKKVYKAYKEKFVDTKLWIEDKEDARTVPTFTIGTCIPIYGRFVMNFSYDHEPQALFVGFTIRAWDSYDEID
jgi:hypothetical protein